MIDQSQLNIPLLANIFLIANTPGYLYRQFQTAEPTIALAKQYDAFQLVAAISDLLEKEPPLSLADIVTIYAATVAMSFRPASEVGAALVKISKKRITWLDDLLARINSPTRVASHDFHVSIQQPSAQLTRSEHPTAAVSASRTYSTGTARPIVIPQKPPTAVATFKEEKNFED